MSNAINFIFALLKAGEFLKPTRLPMRPIKDAMPPHPLFHALR
jgi:hypothetical protein